MPNKHSVGCKCCTECEILLDTFDRDDSTDLGSDWSEVSGSWAISSNAASGSGLLIAVNGHPTGGTNIHARAVFADTNAKIIIGYDDSSNYHYAIFDGTAVTLYEVVSGTATALVTSDEVDYTSGGAYVLSICYDGVTLFGYVSTDDAVGSVAWLVSSLAGDQGGLGATSTIDCESFELTIAGTESVSCPKCPQNTIPNICGCEEGDYLYQSYLMDWDGTLSASTDPLGNWVCNDATCNTIEGPVIVDYVPGPFPLWNYSEPFCESPQQCFFIPTVDPRQWAAGIQCEYSVSEGRRWRIFVNCACSGRVGGSTAGYSDWVNPPEECETIGNDWVEVTSYTSNSWTACTGTLSNLKFMKVSP